MKLLVRALLGVAVALPVVVDAQVIRPVTPPPVVVPLPMVTMTIQYPPQLSTTTSLPPPIQTPTIVLTVTAPTAAAPNAEREAEANVTATSPNPTGDQTAAEPGAPNVRPPGDESEGAEGDGEECDDERGNALDTAGSPDTCQDNGAAAEAGDPPSSVALDWYAIALLLACAALVIFWIRTILRR